jgi:uncharacterized membrane protein YkoI
VEARRAVATAERSVRRSRAYDIETDQLQGERVWDVEVARSTTRAYELDVRADGRKVVRQRRVPNVDDDVRKLASAGVSLRQALEIAGARWKADRFDEAEIDVWRGRAVWEVTFRSAGHREVEVRIDARSGTVIAVEVDD